MQFNIEIINVQAVTKPTAKGSYIMLDVAYRNLSTDKVEGKKIMSFVDKDLYNVMSKAAMGAKFTITSEKKPNRDGIEYWTWILAVPFDGAQPDAATPSKPAASSGGFASPKSTYETADERAARQVLIVRQSSLSNAIESLKVDKKPVDLQEVLAIADTYCNWVFQKNITLGEDTNFADMADDIPM